MTDQNINMAIAECLGWEFSPSADRKTEFGWEAIPECWIAEDGTEHYVLSFADDLNAMNQAEATLTEDERSLTYLINLTTAIPDDTSRTYATARQRAEAFLRTKGKWRE